MPIASNDNADNGRPTYMAKKTTTSIHEFDHTVLAFELFGRQMRRVIDDPCEWVWAIIALHSGIQSMMVLALTGTDGLNALDKRDHIRWLDKYNEYRKGEPCPSKLRSEIEDMISALKGSDEPGIIARFVSRITLGRAKTEPRPRRARLDTFRNLYKKVKRNKRLNFVPGDRQNRFVKRLNEWRDQFIHFPHLTLVFADEEFHQMASDCLEVAERLFSILTDGSPENLHRSNTLIWSEFAMKERLQEALTLARQLLDSHG